jgi:hypothetical protein
MEHVGLFQTAACAAVLFAALPQRAVSSDQWFKTTIIDFSSPVRVPGKTLPAGKYTFKLVQSPAMQLQVQIFNERQSQILATVNTSPTFRQEPPDKTIIVFYEAPAGQPEPIKAWLYPGDQYGREFIYSKSERATILSAANTQPDTTTAVAQTVAPAAPVEVAAVEAAPAQDVVAEAPAAEAPAPAVVAEPAPEPVVEPVQETPVEPAPEPTTMPSTGSDLPLVGLAGLLSLAGALAIRFRARLT